MNYKPIVLIRREEGILDYDLPRHSLWVTQHNQRRRVATAHKSPDGRWKLEYGATSKSFDSLIEGAQWLMQELIGLIRTGEGEQIG